MHLFAAVCVIISILEEVDSFCPSQCSCIYHGMSDGTRTRSVLCNDPDMFEIPLNIPVDSVKLRVEKTVIRKVPADAFYYLVDLKYLWLTYNSITNIDSRSFYNLKQLHELRLDGNLLLRFPWESLTEMPNLRTLDLHNNKMTSIPVEAGKYLRNLTYLDISSNKLTTLPSDLMDIWLPFSETKVPRNTDSLVLRVILGLQDNPWYCDCRISKLIEFSKTGDSVLILLDPFVACNGPESLSGILFQRAELEQCLKPSVMTSATKITSPLGSNVLLRCDATGYPTPQLTWLRSNNRPVNYTVIQESPGEGERWSIISLTGISYKDAGDYRCKAKNFAGMSEAFVTLTVIGVVTTTEPSPKYGKKTGTEQANSTQEDVKPEFFNVTLFSSTIASTTTTPSTITATTETFTTKSETDTKQPELMAEYKKNGNTIVNGRKKQLDTSLSVESADEQNVTLKNLRVIPESSERVTLMWKNIDVSNSSALTVLYSKYGEKEMVSLNPDPTKNKVTIDGLEPSTKYMACVCPKEMLPTKDQCIIFSTDGINMEDKSPISILLVASGVACAIVIPLIFFLLYKVVRLHRKPKLIKEEELAKETYIKFETLSFRPHSMGANVEIWTHRNTDESERQLLCSRSSMDSQMTFKSEGSRSEYFC
ncbi:leucine-rich repeat, immunoglobulin-like domain and transmembrane domain-containing protein 3 isoform X1 [Ahaetulla prasina]|uniref:leucine-rich repeat, immunoglobulin-like domain and transmembrane domain-containing protein 3 isoform X1 n=1 Tax=Ahaetulla prasina TaxID=499056 RepID=UPI002649E08A|nr:leucine-rich repeat, immunoglobulin-like domain and transmembrane domain-containing protein 3 isoform X1 [Ahaetulla prasina]